MIMMLVWQLIQSLMLLTSQEMVPISALSAASIHFVSMANSVLKPMDRLPSTRKQIRQCRRLGEAKASVKPKRGLPYPRAKRTRKAKAKAVGLIDHSLTENQLASVDQAEQSCGEVVVRDGGVDTSEAWKLNGPVSPSTLIIAEIREQWRRRQQWHRAEKSLTLQSKALCRRLATDGDKKEADTIYSAALGKGSHPMSDIAMGAIFPLIDARDGIAKHRAAVEKQIVKLAKQLPVASFVIGVRGVGLASLAAIVGEAGDLSNYGTVSRLWKRMGLAVMPDGTRQRRIAGDAAIEHGYSPARRSVVWNIGACIVKAGGPLKQIYDDRKVYELTRVATKAHAHNRAQRYVEKRFLAMLWAEWLRPKAAVIPTTAMGAANFDHPEGA